MINTEGICLACGRIHIGDHATCEDCITKVIEFNGLEYNDILADVVDENIISGVFSAV